MTKDQLRQIKDAVEGILKELKSDEPDEDTFADYGNDIVAIAVGSTDLDGEEEEEEVS